MVNQMNEDFIDACENGDLGKAKKLYELGVNIHCENDYGFRRACMYGRFDVVKWLYDIGDVYIRAGDDYSLVYSFLAGHHEISKWLFAKYNKDENPNFYIYNKLKKIIESEKEIYKSELILIFHFNGLIEIPICDLNLLIIKFFEYLFY